MPFSYVFSYIAARNACVFCNASKMLSLVKSRGNGPPLKETPLSTIEPLRNEIISLYHPASAFGSRNVSSRINDGWPTGTRPRAPGEIEEVSMTIAETVVKALAETGRTIACAETLTGGGITRALIRVPGSSRVLGYSAVAYSDRAKTGILGVDPETIRRFGAVSEETAREMAEGVANAAGADLGLAVTGVAGPGGGTAEKPVGMVCFALKAEGETIARTLRFGNPGRTEIMERSVTAALELTADYLSHRAGEKTGDAKKGGDRL